MANGVRQVEVFRDDKGNIGRASFFVLNDTFTNMATAAGNVRTTLFPLSNAASQRSRGPFSTIEKGAVYGAAASYASVEDKAIFTFETADGSIHRIQVPSPKAAIFRADQETIDGSNALVIAFNTAMLTNATDAFGNPLQGGFGGFRIRRKAHRKLNVFILDPSLNEPAE